MVIMAKLYVDSLFLCKDQVTEKDDLVRCRWFVVLEEARDVDMPGWQETGGLTPDPQPRS